MRQEGTYMSTETDIEYMYMYTKKKIQVIEVI